MMNKEKTQLLALAVLGIVLGIFEHRAAIIYALIGFGMLILVQVSVLLRSKTGWQLIGGNPFLKLDSKERPAALMGMVMLVSGFGTFLIKIAYLANAL